MDALARDEVKPLALLSDHSKKGRSVLVTRVVAPHRGRA